VTLDRIQQGQPGNLTLRLVTPAGAPTDPTPDSATVRVVRDDGTEVIPSVAANDSGTGVFSVPYTATQAALLDRWTAYWTTTVNGQPRVDTTTHEVVGGFLFALAELSGTGATDAQLQATRTTVEQAIEDACGCAFVPRYDRATLSGDGTTLLRVGRPFLRRVRWASTSTLGITTPLTTTDVAGLTAVPYGFVTGGYRWMAGSLVTVGYEFGMDRPPEPVRAAALDYARFLLTQDTSIDSRAERLQTDDGTLVFGGGQTGLPGVDRVIDQYRMLTIA
jgi:hypothetical protein